MRAWIVPMGLLLVVVTPGCRNERDSAIAEIERLGGRVEYDEESPNSPIVGVELGFTDAGLEFLEDLTSLKYLVLWDTKVTDADLEHLEGLTSLHTLHLDNTQVSDGGLEHLKGLTNLQTLGLSDTQVTDAGLESLKGLTSLQDLRLHRTKVTDAGVNELKKALPNCEISH